MTCGKDRVGEETKAEVTVEGEIKVGGTEVKAEVKLEGESSAAKPKKKGARRSWWCPIVGCSSGSSRTLTYYVTPGPSRELPEYMPLQTEVPSRSPGGSKDRKGKRVGQRVKGGQAKRGGESARGGSTRADEGATTKRDERGGENGEGGTGLGLDKEGQGGDMDGETFLRNFGDYLKSAVGGSKNSRATTQVVANVHKYLDHLDPGDMRPERLL